jgi:hypothetical protein
VPAVDYERVVVKLRREIASKPSHGRDALLVRMAEIEAECELPEPQSLYDDRPLPLPPRPAAVTEHDGGENAEHDAASHDDEGLEPIETAPLLGPDRAIA